MFYLNIIWKDYDGYYNEKYDDITKLGEKLIHLANKEEAENYGTEIISLIQGEEVDYQYTVDGINLTESIIIQGKTVITNKLPGPIEKAKIICPRCGTEAKEKSSVPFTYKKEYSVLVAYECTLPSCGETFYI